MTDVRLPQHGRDHRPGGSDPIPITADGPRLVYGSVADDGTTANAGSGGWTITKDGFTPGVYLITFDPAFSAPPIVTATVTNDDVLGDGPFIATLDPTRDESSVTVRVWEIDIAPGPFDGPFDFIAVGA